MNDTAAINHHLNLFQFFSDSESDPQTRENNVSRGLALCLQSDAMFLDHFLQLVFRDNLAHYHALLSSRGGSLSVDIQRSAKSFANVKKIVGVSLTAAVLDMGDVEPGSAIDPITDIAIECHEFVILIEVKLDGTDARAQVENQIATAVLASEEEPEIYKTSISWSQVVDKLWEVVEFKLRLEEQADLLVHFKDFLFVRFPNYFPIQQLRDIPITSGDREQQAYRIQRRLDYLISQMQVGELSNKKSRTSIAINRPYVNELMIQFEMVDEKPYIALKLWIGDTTGQGRALYRRDEPISLPENIKEFQLLQRPYVKFSDSYGGGVDWINHLSVKEYRNTHRKNFFDRVAGKRWRKDWVALDSALSSEIPDWKTRSKWTEVFENSNRQLCVIALGIHLALLIPYDVAQKHDSMLENSDFIRFLDMIAGEFLETINSQV